MQTLPTALAPLAAYRQFLCYALVPSKSRAGKMDKLPVSPHSGQFVDAHDSQHWTDAAHACAVASHWGAGYGVAFVLTKADPFFFVDIDHAWDGRQWSEVAQQVVALFPGAALEVSQSGTGLHIFGRGQAPAHGKRNDAHGLEFYTELRFAALTGINAVGDANTDHTVALHTLTQAFFPPKADAGGDWSLSTAPVPEWRGPTDDADLIRRALMSRSAASVFGGRASFADLWEGNSEALAKAYPDPERLYNASAADAALAAHLAFWTGRHGERIQRLMMQSALVRDKWHRDDYLPRTIANVLAQPGDVLTDREPEPPPTPPAAPEAPRQTVVEGQTFLNAEAQRELFTGCVYVQDLHRVLVPGGSLLKPDQFRVAFGGYSFCMDNANQRTSRNAWEAFTESQVLRAPRADSICFKPARAPGEIIEEAGRTRANIWWPANVRRKVGDVTPFLQHLQKMLPNERDRMLILSYMAAIVQHKGVKFTWAPVLQGAEGNGKSTLSSCVAMAVGQHYVHWPDARDLLSPFNGWLSNRVFIAVEELRTQDPQHREEVVEVMKTVINGGVGKQIQFKGVDQTSAEICCNLIINTNYRDAVRKTPDNARRFGLFYMAQQSLADIERDGMGGDYFPKFYAWLRADGFAIVSELLHTFPIPDEFNPINMSRAPHTSTTDLAIVESRGAVEQHIAEAIAQDTPGFMGGWISSVQLDHFITNVLKMGTRITPSKRREMLGAMGYVLHPGLTDGRVNNPVLPDGRKPQLYVLAGSPQARMVGAAEIARAYTAAQSVNTVKG